MEEDCDHWIAKMVNIMLVLMCVAKMVNIILVLMCVAKMVNIIRVLMCVAMLYIHINFYSLLI